MEKRDRLLYQYKNAPNFKAFLDSIYELVDDASPIGILDFFDIDNAEGVWLTQLADMWNVPRSYCAVGTAFILDFSTLDGPDVLDGGQTPVDDVVLKALLKAQILKNTSGVKSVDYIYSVFNTAVAPVDIEIVEGVRELTINVTFVTDSQNYYTYVALVNLDTKWFGCPASTSVTYSETLI
jgi:penicillin V acylase-like amidase (Ntn superfamily)